MLTPAAWHRRFAQQARWTAQLREHAFLRLGLQTADRVLEVGCGTGAVLAELPRLTDAALFGIDLDAARLRLAVESAPGAGGLAAADGLRLPFPAGSFDAVVCHYYLLWVADVVQAVAEMVRVTRPGGWVLALAEPDHAARVDAPRELEMLGRLQTDSLARQGADVTAGRRLAGRLRGAGLRDVTVGVLGGEWGAPDMAAWADEWAVLEDDLRKAQPGVRLATLREMDRAAWERGERVLFVPTFFGWGRKA